MKHFKSTCKLDTSARLVVVIQVFFAILASIGKRIGSMLYCIVSIKRIINVFYCHSATIAFNITTNSILIIKYLRKRVIDCLLKCCLCTMTENTDARNWSILF
jgi:hypothetical protein